MDLNESKNKTKSIFSKIKFPKQLKRFGTIQDIDTLPSSSNYFNKLAKMQGTKTNKSKQHDENTNDNKDEEASASKFECNICLEPAKDAVISMCGHLFCWPCLHQWFETRPNKTLCPVCKDSISRDKVIPLYGRDNVDGNGGGTGTTTGNKDPRNKKYPPRPPGQRSGTPSGGNGSNPEAGYFFGSGNGSSSASFFDTGLSGPNNVFGPGIHMAFGIGAFPFGFFTTMFNLGGMFPPAATTSTPSTTQGTEPQAPNGSQSPFTDPHYAADDQFLSKMFLWVAIIFIVWLLLA